MAVNKDGQRAQKTNVLFPEYLLLLFVFNFFIMLI